MPLSAEEQRRAISRWLRTGLLPVARSASGLELKFNPHHNPRNGQFTFANGIGVGQSAHLALVQEEGREPRLGRGGNIRVFDDPMTLEEAIPALKNSIAGAVWAIPDALFDLSGPAADLQIEVLDGKAQQALNDIKRLDPSFRYDELGPIETVEGKINRLNDIRLLRALVYIRARGDYEPLKIETLRVARKEVDEAYERGVRLLAQGKLRRGVTNRMRLGNYIDQQVREKIRNIFQQYGIKREGGGSIRVNRREGISSLDKFVVPDTGIFDLRIDYTMSEKSLKDSQVRLFFRSDAAPRHVAILRPSAESRNHSYIITRPRQDK